MITKTKTTLLVLFGFLFVFSINITQFMQNRENPIKTTNTNYDNLEFSAIMGKIHIDNNWTEAKTAGICTGTGTYSVPYIIEDLTIDGGGSGSCILIENSDVYFTIENCTTLNPGVGLNHGIKFGNVSNSKLINNNCSSIYLFNCKNNTLSGNIINKLDLGIYDGIDLRYCQNNTILGNFISNCDNNGIIIRQYSHDNIISNNIIQDADKSIFIYGNSWDITIKGNIMERHGLFIYFTSLGVMNSHNIDATNLVNGKPIYYYANEINLIPSDFTNAGQIILVNCSYSLIANIHSTIFNGIELYYCNYNEIFGNNASYTSSGGKGICMFYCDNNNITENTVIDNMYGIYMKHCNYNNITGNTANSNHYAIHLTACDYNIISENNLIGNDHCIYEHSCHDNIIQNNNCGAKAISGYYLIFLFTILSIVTIILSRKVKKITL